MSHVETLDVSSAGELERAVQSGWDAHRLSFTGPGKQPWELELAAENTIGEVILESLLEARRLSEIATARQQTVDVMIRIAPNVCAQRFWR